MSRFAVIHGAPPTLVGVPVMETLPSDEPHWITDRGHDVRALDFTEDREVYGPSHHFNVERDIVVTNGMLRFQVGERNVIPHLHVEVYKGGAWRDKGYLWLSTTNLLVGARLVLVTPERAVVVLQVRNEGEVFVSLQRGERMVRIAHGSTRAPIATVDRHVFWRNTAPGGVEPGIFGSAVTAGRVFEATTDGGVTRVTDAYGLTRAVAVLRSGATRSDLGFVRNAQTYDVGAFVATAATGDDVADYQKQLSVASEQELRVR